MLVAGCSTLVEDPDFSGLKKEKNPYPSHNPVSRSQYSEEAIKGGMSYIFTSCGRRL
jgi:hypothetical protein